MKDNYRHFANHFTNEGRPVHVVVCHVGPGDRATTVRMIFDDRTWRDGDRERDIARVDIPVSKKAIYEQFASMGFPPHVMHRLAKDLRRQSVFCAAKNWDHVLPPDVVAWADRELREHMADEPCVDNLRVARINSSPQMRRFRRQAASGCCGSATFERTGPDGKKYILGYNYGH
jgi:hypothetical protein